MEIKKETIKLDIKISKELYLIFFFIKLSYKEVFIIKVNLDFRKLFIYKYIICIIYVILKMKHNLFM